MLISEENTASEEKTWSQTSSKTPQAPGSSGRAQAQKEQAKA
jgi:hypothetical protein